MIVGVIASFGCSSTIIGGVKCFMKAWEPAPFDTGLISRAPPPPPPALLFCGAT